MPRAVAQRHARVRAADGALTQLDVAIRRSFGAPEGDLQTIGTGGPHKAHFAPGVEPVEDFQPSGEKLQRAFLRHREAQQVPLNLCARYTVFKHREVF